MAYVRKTHDEWVIEQNWENGEGWEVVARADSIKEGRALLQDYYDNEPQTPVRITRRRVPNG